MAHVQRDLSTSVASAGGYLASDVAVRLVDALRPWSVTAQAAYFLAT